ncbi:MAG: signal peptide peptidase SppA [Verrucomicrobiota bacterium]
MKQFFQTFAANLLAIIVAGVLISATSFLLLLGISALSTTKPETTVPEDTVLVLDLWTNISDSPPVTYLSDVVDEVIYGPEIPRLYLLELVDAIERAASDDSIEALFLYGSLMPDNYGSGLAALREVRQAIQSFKDSGKPVYAYVVDPTQRDYYLISVADEIYQNPFGLVSLNGLSSEMLYFGDAFEKYGIGVQTTRVGKYKSAVEMFTSNKMSDADRTQLVELLDDLWIEMLTDIAAGRGMEWTELKSLSDEKGFFTSQNAKKAGLVDELLYLDQVIDKLTELSGYDVDLESFNQIGMMDYIQASGFAREDRSLSADQVAVIYAEGDIVDGEGFDNQVGGDRLARELRYLRQDPDIAAIVLRVNSPGGSALASEVIQREVREAAQAKPVVVSMGSLAASGGYWISAYADHIFAEPTTITGSIGVWGLLFNVQGLANEHGLTFDGVKTSPFADIYTLSRPKTEEEMAMVQTFTDYIYEEFLRKVAEGRDLDMSDVEMIAQGRIWSGMDAIEAGLVDQIGGLGDAIRYAADMAELGDAYTVTQVPEKKGFSETLAEILSATGQQAPVVNTRGDALSALIRQLKHELAAMRSFNDPKGIYARLPYQLDIR